MNRFATDPMTWTKIFAIAGCGALGGLLLGLLVMLIDKLDR
jgi:hypothetical protein